MNRDPEAIHIFVSCPSDMTLEKRIVLNEINKLNIVLSDAYRVTLRALTWEDDVYSAMGADGQDVINTQIGDEYDVYLGLVGSRLGSPTRRSASGTVEEYERAMTRHKDGKKPQMLFFVVEKPLTTTSQELSEAVKVQSFVNRVREDGMLTKTVTSQTLDTVVHTHLYRTLFSVGFTRKIEGLNTAETLHRLSDTLYGSQCALQDSLFELRDEIGHLDGPASWTIKYLALGKTGFIYIGSDDTVAASTELEELVTQIDTAFELVRRRFKLYVESAFKLHSHPVLQTQIEGIDDYLKWNLNTSGMLRQVSAFLSDRQTRYGHLSTKSATLKIASDKLVSLFKKMSDEFLAQSESLDTIRLIVNEAIKPA